MKGLKHVCRDGCALMRRLPAGVVSCVMVLGVLWLTLAPKPLPDSHLPVFPGADKLVHACMFGVLFAVMCVDAALLRNAEVPENGTAITPCGKAMMAVIAVFTVMFGGVIELTQDGMGLGRGGDLWDFVADAAGVALAAVILRRQQR